MDLELIHEEAKLKALKLLFQSKLNLLRKTSKTKEEFIKSLDSLKDEFYAKAIELSYRVRIGPSVAVSISNFLRYLRLA